MVNALLVLIKSLAVEASMVSNLYCVHGLGYVFHQKILDGQMSKEYLVSRWRRNAITMAHELIYSR